MKLTDAKYVGSYPDYKMAPKSILPEISFGGRSNVGKSSLINSLVKKRNLAQVAKAPGKTKLLNYFVLSDKPGRDFLHFVDLPGFGYAKVSVETRQNWQKIIEAYIEGSKNLKGFCILIDSRRGLQDEELQLIEYLKIQQKNICLILTKSDKLTRQEGSLIVKKTAEELKHLGGEAIFPVLHSAKTGVGNDLIWRWIAERIKK